MGRRLRVGRRNLKITVKTQSSSQCTPAKTPEQIIFVEKAVGQPQVRLEKIYGGMCNE